MNTYILVMLACFVAAGVNALWFGLELRRYVLTTHSLSNPVHIYHFKRIVAHQMYAALIQIVFLLVPPIVFFFGIRSEVLSAADILYVIVPSAIIIVIAVYFKGFESQAQSLPTAYSELEAQRDAVVRTWLRKPLPNW